VLFLLAGKKSAIDMEDIDQHDVKEEREKQRVHVQPEFCRVGEHRSGNFIAIKQPDKFKRKHRDEHGKNQEEYVYKFFPSVGKHHQHHG
jgi:hypothetical protein